MRITENYFGVRGPFDSLIIHYCLVCSSNLPYIFYMVIFMHVICQGKNARIELSPSALEAGKYLLSITLNHLLSLMLKLIIGQSRPSSNPNRTNHLFYLII